MQIYTKSGPEIGRGKVDTSGVSLEFDFLFASSSFSQFSFYCLTWPSKSFSMLVKAVHNCL